MSTQEKKVMDGRHAVLEDLMSEIGDTVYDMQLGKRYIIWTVTHHFRGKLIKITPEVFVLEDCTMIFRTGPFNNMHENGPAEEEALKTFRLFKQVIVGAEEE